MNIQKFIEIEEKYNLYTKKIDDCPYWILNRFSIWNYNICKESLNLSNPVNKVKRIPWLSYIKNSIKSLITFLEKKDKKDILFLNTPNRIFKDNRYICAYTEQLHEIFPNSLTAEGPTQWKHFEPVTTKNLVYLDIIEFFCILHTKIKFFDYYRIKETVLKELSQPLKELSDYYKWNPSEKLIDNIVKKIINYKFTKNLYRKFIIKFSPKLIVEIVYYEWKNMIINSIAKELGIKTIELQHGTMYNDHAAYHYSPNLKYLKELPDEIFLFSDYWKKNITIPISSEHLHSVGFPMFDEKYNQYKNVAKEKNDKTTILFVSQGTIGLELSKLAVNLSKILDKEGFKIIYKLHPNEYNGWQEKYPNLKDGVIEVIDKRSSIYEYFAKSDYLVGVYSTALFEGIGFGLTTYIYKIGHYNVMSDLVKDGYAKYVETAQDLFDSINNPQQTKTISNLWKRDSLNNMVTLINHFLSEIKRE